MRENFTKDTSSCVWIRDIQDYLSRSVLWIVRPANRLKEWPSCFGSVLVASKALSTNYSPFDIFQE